MRYKYAVLNSENCVVLSAILKYSNGKQNIQSSIQYSIDEATAYPILVA